MVIYCEKQVGNNCRIHSLNAFFGGQKIDRSLFDTHCEEYDKLIFGLNSRDMDGFAECRSIISFIIDVYTKKFCKLIPINFNGISSDNRQMWDYNRFIPSLGKSIHEYFEFNKDHVWFNKFENGIWNKIDSMHGVTQINTLTQFGDNGYLLIFNNDDTKMEIDYLLDFIYRYFIDKINNHPPKNTLLFKIFTDIDSELEVAIYNLYHLLSRETLEYQNDSEINRIISKKRTVLKLTHIFIDTCRRKTINTKKIIKIANELKNIVIYNMSITVPIY